MTASRRTAGLVLAAGSGTRFGGPKAPVLVEGERLVDRAVRVLQAGGCSPVLVVLGAWQGEVSGAITVVNPKWATGMGSSLSVGLRSLLEDPLWAEVEAVLITLVDLPGLTSTAVERVIAVDADLVAATYAGERGHPILFARKHWSAVAESAQGDAGARNFLRGRTDLAYIDVGDIASGTDVDRPEDLPGR
jgi:CTP:molybdopterin cytidylyltransferase MocA